VHCKVKKWTLILSLALLACNSEQTTQQADTADNNVRTSGATKIEGLDVYYFAIYTETDTIEYIKIGTDTLTAKPTILFLQGSLPSPLVFDLGSFKPINLPFDYKALTDKYNMIEITMPRTPVIAGKGHLNQQYCYVPDTADEDSFKTSYLRDNYLQNYVDRTNHVIADLLKRQWVLQDSIHLIGHSQGAKIATVVASENSHVASVALLGFNAFGRFDEYIRRERQKLKSGQISGEEYKKNIEAHYQRWAEINETPKDFEKGHNAWTTFSIDYTPYLFKINIPIFIGYGTEDIIADNCDLLPIKFIQNGKTNLTLKPYIGLDHNFFELKDGKPDYKNGKRWTDVVKDIVKWMEQNNDTPTIAK